MIERARNIIRENPATTGAVVGSITGFAAVFIPVMVLSLQNGKEGAELAVPFFISGIGGFLTGCLGYAIGKNINQVNDFLDQTGEVVFSRLLGNGP